MFFVGYLATSKNSALRRLSSRFWTLVLIEAVSMETYTLDLVMSWSLISTTPLCFSKLPLTLDIIRCRTLKPIFECSGSIFQIVADASAGRDRAMMVLTVVSKRVMIILLGCPVTF